MRAIALAVNSANSMESWIVGMVVIDVGSQEIVDDFRKMCCSRSDREKL